MNPNEHWNILPATQEEKEWGARVMAATDPWITLQFSIEQCRKSCLDPHYNMYIAHQNSMPCGMILLDPRGVAGSPYIKTIAVQEDFRGKGIGSALIAFTESVFQNESRHLFICVSSFNKKARSLYERLGFHQVGEFKDYIVPGKSEILLYKSLH